MPPACKGKDLLTELERADPTGYAAIMAAANAVPNAKGLLWRIQKAELADSFLFGTAHVADDRVTNFSASVKEAFARAKRVAFENDPSTVGKSIRQIGTLGKYGDGRSLKTELPRAEYLAFTQMLKKLGMEEDSFDETKPWLIRLPLPCEQARAKYGMKVLDERLYADAMTRGVSVVGLENVEEKLRLQAAISTFTQLVTLVSSVRQSELAEDQLETIIQMYVRHDLGPVGPLGRYWDEKTGMPLSAIEETSAYHVRRNYTMRDAALPVLARGGLFIAVGAAHLQGAEGLVELFRQSGYQLSVVE
jgi:uncharacterized protein